MILTLNVHIHMYMYVFICITVTSLQSGSPVSVYNRDHAVKVGPLQHSGGCIPAVGSHNLFLYLLFLEVQESEALSHIKTQGNKHTQNYLNIYHRQFLQQINVQLKTFKRHFIYSFIFRKKYFYLLYEPMFDISTSLLFEHVSH